MLEIEGYEVIEKIGSGGFGTVYKAKDILLDRYVAIKKIKADYENAQELVGSFFNEGKALAKLDCPNIVKVYHMKQDNDTIYIIMEYIDGCSLYDLIDKNVPSKETVQKRLVIFEQILEALLYAHGQGVIHRDLKPGNIMIDKEDRVKIVDFGLALLKDNMNDVDGAACSAFSKYYSAPEHINHEKTDERADIYSLGAILYELLTGKHVFEGENTSELIEQIYYDPAPSVKESNPSISDELSALVAHCLEKEPEKRFQSVQELLKEFDECPENNPVIIEKPGPGPIVDPVNAQVGDRVSFGRYPQGPNGEVEPIIWRVLKRYSKSLLVISEKGLDAEVYDNEEAYSRSITWAGCTLRSWLNREFFEQAFNEQERSLIKIKKIRDDAGHVTKDRIFLLSVSQATRFFSNDRDRVLNSTAYATKNYSYTTSDGTTCWWLLSSGDIGDGAAYVSEYGYVRSDGLFGVCGCSVRPAFLLTIAPTLKIAEDDVESVSEVFKDDAKFTSKVTGDYTNAQVGDCFRFGNYPQGQNGEVEPITWRVLERGNDSLIAISDKGLDAKPYNEDGTDVTWANCTLRRWLNKEFVNRAFDKQEQSLIKAIKLTSTATDRIFLLSIDEALCFFADDDDRMCKTTVYANNRGAFTSFTGTCWWWLRSSGDYSNKTAFVYSSGGVPSQFRPACYSGCSCGSIRPAFQLAINSTSKVAEDDVESVPEVLKDDAKLTPKVAEDYVNARVGDRFWFGHYRQGTNGEIEPIAWRVLERDNDSLLVISDKGLDTKPYNEEWVDTTWSDCTLRRWLNEEFWEQAFNGRERSLIKRSKLSNDVGSNTDDCIFLLSIAEAARLFADDDDRRCKPTAYATRIGALIDDFNGEKEQGNTWWWLRSRGIRVSNAAIVLSSGWIDNYGEEVETYHNSVRPALRLAI
ncbi:MAG: serine/threonine protein kinase [bacterium]|nr:serine/threonine protein kinase [bacterium]